MEQQDIIDSVKLQLGFSLIEPEIDDTEIGKIVDLSLKELNRYYNATELITITGDNVIDLTKYPQVNNIVTVYRTATGQGAGMTDPILTSQLQMYNFGSTAYANNWIYSYGAFSSAQRTANTISTDLNWKEDKKGKKLYINYSSGKPDQITIEYTPKLFDVSEIESDHWIDLLQRLTLAHTKVALGRIRTRFKQSNAQWEGDGEKILEEGNTELTNLRDAMRKAVDYALYVD